MSNCTTYRRYNIQFGVTKNPSTTDRYPGSDARELVGLLTERDSSSPLAHSTGFRIGGDGGARYTISSGVPDKWTAEEFLLAANDELASSGWRVV